MGIWNTSIFGDDFTSDLKDDFRDHIGNGLTSEEATAAIKKTYASSLIDPEEKYTFWIALAASQWKLGLLLPEVRETALQILDDGGDLYRWKEDKQLWEKRRRVLDKLRAQLVSEQPPAKKIPKSFIQSNDWLVGSVQAYALNNGELCLMRVIRHHTDKGGTNAVVELLDWTGIAVPDEREVHSLPIKTGRFTFPSGSEHTATKFFWVASSERDHSMRLKRFFATGILCDPDPNNLKKVGTQVITGKKLDEFLARYFGLGNG